MKPLIIILSILLLTSPQRVYKCWHIVNISVVFTVIMGWIDNLLCRFSNSGFSTQSFWFQNMNMWLFKLISSHYWWRRKMNKVLYIILISVFSITIYSCSSSSDSGSSTTSTTTDDDTTTDDNSTSTSTTAVFGTSLFNSSYFGD